MKRFTEMRLFRILQEVSQSGVDADVQLLKNSYDEFAAQLLSENAPFGHTTYHSTLVYTRVELVGLTGVPRKKCSNLPSQSH